MGSRRNLAREVAARTLAAQLGSEEQPRFIDTTMTVGQHKGFTVGLQFDSAYLHDLDDKRYWLRCRLQDDCQYRSVVRLADGSIRVVRGLRGQGQGFSSDFPFKTEAEMEQILDCIGKTIAAWEPE